MDHSNDDNQQPMGYTQTLNYSQSIRRRIVEKFTAKGIPDDKDSIDIILKSLKDMDNTAILDRKNSIDESGADSSRKVAEAMREFVNMQMNRNPFERAPDGTPVAAPPPKVDLDKLGEFQLVPGEEEIGTILETSAEFMKRMLPPKDGTAARDEE